MAKPFDAATKALLEDHPADWVRWLNYPCAGVELIDADLAAVTAAADRLIRVRDAADWLLHIELQASYEAGLPRRTHWYNTLIEYRHALPVRSVVVLLRPLANSPQFTGLYQRGFIGEELTFRYRVVRLWEIPVAQLLAGGPGIWPLAPLGRVAVEQLPAVVHEMSECLERSHIPPRERRKFWTAAYVLMGLSYDQAFINQLLQGVEDMEESVTYQAIIQKGEQRGAIRELRKTLLRLGTIRFGPPSEEARRTIDSTSDLERLEYLSEKLLRVADWNALMATDSM